MNWTGQSWLVKTVISADTNYPDLRRTRDGRAMEAVHAATAGLPVVDHQMVVG